MATTKDICVLDIREMAGGICSVRFCCWLAVATAYPNALAISAYPNVSTDASTQGVLQLIQAGTLIEEVYNIVLPTSIISGSWATVETLMLAILNARKSYKNGTVAALPDPGLKLGILHDSATGWSA